MSFWISYFAHNIIFRNLFTSMCATYFWFVVIVKAMLQRLRAVAELEFQLKSASPLGRCLLGGSKLPSTGGGIFVFRLQLRPTCLMSNLFKRSIYSLSWLKLLLLLRRLPCRRALPQLLRRVSASMEWKVAHCRIAASLTETSIGRLLRSQ